MHNTYYRHLFQIVYIACAFFHDLEVPTPQSYRVSSRKGRERGEWVGSGQGG